MPTNLLLFGRRLTPYSLLPKLQVSDVEAAEENDAESKHKHEFSPVDFSTTASFGVSFEVDETEVLKLSERKAAKEARRSAAKVYESLQTTDVATFFCSVLSSNQLEKIEEELSSFKRRLLNGDVIVPIAWLEIRPVDVISLARFASSVPPPLILRASSRDVVQFLRKRNRSQSSLEYSPPKLIHMSPRPMTQQTGSEAKRLLRMRSSLSDDAVLYKSYSSDSPTSSFASPTYSQPSLTDDELVRYSSESGPLSSAGPTPQGFESNGVAPLRVSALKFSVSEEEPFFKSYGELLPLNGDGSTEISNKSITLLKLLGRGGSGRVYLGRVEGIGQPVAVKVVRTNAGKQILKMMRQEICLLRSAADEHIIKYYGFSYSKSNRECRILLEYAEGGSLSDLVDAQSPLPLPATSYVVHSLLLALSSLHRRRIIHRDVKPSNVLLMADASIRLSDLGVGVLISDMISARRSVVGTPWYVAPEVIRVDSYGTPVDIWSLACLTLELLTGARPYGRLNAIAAMYRMAEDETPPMPSSLPAEAKAFLLRCFKKNWRDRPSAEELLGDLFVEARQGGQEILKARIETRRSKTD
jgi:hypothetical protein